MPNVNVKFVDTSEECIKLMRKYAREGLKAGGKIVTKILKDDIKNNHYKTGSLYNEVFAKVEFIKGTGQPHLLIGYRNYESMKKKGYKHYVNPYWFEFGVQPHEIKTKALVKYGQSDYELKDNKGTKFGVIVRHPGMTSKNFLRNTVYNNVKEINEAEQESLQKITDLKVELGMSIDVDESEEEIE